MRRRRTGGRAREAAGHSTSRSEARSTLHSSAPVDPPPAGGRRALGDLWDRLAMLADALRRRSRGEFEVDPYGLDMEMLHAVRTVTRWMYRRWFRVNAIGLENVPAHGRALLVGNHSGVLFPWDGAMITEAIWSEHPEPRHVRWMILDWAMRLPVASKYMSRLGCVQGRPENARRLLEEDRLVGVFPEGLKGFAKPFADRYRLARFGRGGFVELAMRTRTPIVPVAVIGGEETHPALAFANWLPRPMGVPYVPLTPTFPWLGPLGMIPLPSRWTIEFGRPIRFTAKAPAMADDFLIVSTLTERVRRTIQSQVDRLLAARTSVF